VTWHWLVVLQRRRRQLSRTCWGVPWLWLWLVVDGRCGQWRGGVAVVEGAGVGNDGAVGG
jgi:hypothetical protein